MKLNKLVPEKSGWAINGEASIEIKAICSDSRKVVPGSVFVAIKGFAADGQKFIPNAIQSGATVIVSEDENAEGSEVVWIKVPNARRALAIMAHRFYGTPSEKIRLVGVTGTNGKTTTVMMMHRLFTAMGYKAGLISTVRYAYPDFEDAATHTTPDPVRVCELLSEMVDAGCSHAFMEVSSHASDQDRVAGLNFSGAVFTNITHDHLDYHKTFKAYIGAKKKFFDELNAQAFALVNVDDPNGRVMVQNTKAKIRGYALKHPADFHARVLEDGLEGLHMQIDGQDFYSPLIGGFNAYNLLAVYGVSVLLGENSQEVLTALSSIPPAPGRFELVRQEDGITGVIDYAHTPDALNQVLRTIEKSSAQESAVITVVGCGGDRDKLKRPEMARIAVKHSDKVIFTSDNPRSEDPEVIIDEMMAGVEIGDQEKVFRITNRREAIRMACALAKGRDVVLVAGKGHEKYQEVNGERMPFDDMKELKAALLKDI
jgi:UDP-N-acetylmuramoyl-L-alanyl-D-glutamate--2,6-diaminopimelate ligase